MSSKIFNENLVAVHKIKETLTMNRPAYVGACILDLSKTLMYDFHYNYIKHKYGNKAKLLFTDTDSLTYQIETNNAYKDFFKDKSKFDNSDYPENSSYFNKTNKKVLGKFKDEASGVPIIEFVGLRSKMYSYMKDNDKDVKTAKGIKKNVIKKDIKHEDYKEVLFNNKQMHHTIKTIRSNNHQLGSFELNKISLSMLRRQKIHTSKWYNKLRLWSLQNLKRCDVTAQLCRSMCPRHCCAGLHTSTDKPSFTNQMMFH